MVFDFRAASGTPERRNAHLAAKAICRVNGHLIDRVCYADTDRGVVHALAIRQFDNGNGTVVCGPYLYGRGYHGRSIDLPVGVAYYEVVEPAVDEPVRVRHYGVVEIINDDGSTLARTADFVEIHLAPSTRVYEFD